MIHNLRKLRDTAQAQMDAEGNGDQMLGLKYDRPFSERVVHKWRIKGNFREVIQTCVEDTNKRKLYGLIGKGVESAEDRRKHRLNEIQRAKEN